ncbi:proton-conducting transporter transmembrane domain-containing protein [Psychroflexus sediminis]|uniref:NAD(P)H-quinone oxidoreductase subunit 5 n=1 Tax=Psychroflexus sediminis TaxID=470826 RepID=A0A1G7VY21_9FLAO|nr:proton-conducting transporter membrane subunit [Psychroflexus sediminis]SDG64339.1 NAD(P)H-quinone oxidoreductase subunit 5 [Psychroflexus sediminis]
MESYTLSTLENQTEEQPNGIPLVSRISSKLHWFLLTASILALIFYQVFAPNWEYLDIFRINGFTLLIWTTVLFFSSIVSSYSKNYLTGFQYQKRFSLFSICFTLSVMLFVASNHILPLLISWFAMGYFMAKLIGVNKTWGEARQAETFSLRYFISGALVLTIGILLLCYDSDQFTLQGLMITDEFSNSILIISTVLIIIAATIQSAIFPFHRWLLSAMTSPTPASALMHAGFVNGSGLLLTLFAPLLILSNTLWILFIIGGITAILAQFQKLIQVNVKHKLACSTIAQMGFMIMQCGLGFFNAAIAHLILHGFYKAYLFLSSGEQVMQSSPQESPRIKITFLQAVAVLLFGVLGAFLFSYLTGKTNTTDSSIFLTLIVAITVGQATYNIVKEKSFSYIEKLVASAVLFIVGISVYALLFNGITILMSEMPMIQVPHSLDTLQIVFGVIFLIGFFIMKLGVHRKSPWLYVKLLNLSQPYKKTIHYYKK